MRDFFLSSSPTIFILFVFVLLFAHVERFMGLLNLLFFVNTTLGGMRKLGSFGMRLLKEKHATNFQERCI